MIYHLFLNQYHLYQYIVIVKPLELRIRVKILMEKKKHMIIRHNKHIRHLISHGIISLDFVMSEKNYRFAH